MGVATNTTTLKQLLELDTPFSIFGCGERRRRGGRGAKDAGTRGRRADEDVSDAPPPLSVFHAVKGWTYCGNLSSVEMESFQHSIPEQTLAQARASLRQPDAKRVRGDIELLADDDALASQPASSSTNDAASSRRTRKLIEEWTRPAYISDSTGDGQCPPPIACFALVP